MLKQHADVLMICETHLDENRSADVAGRLKYGILGRPPEAHSHDLKRSLKETMQEDVDVAWVGAVVAEASGAESSLQENLDVALVDAVFIEASGAEISLQETSKETM